MRPIRTAPWTTLRSAAGREWSSRPAGVRSVESVDPPRPLFPSVARRAPLGPVVRRELRALDGFSLICGRYEGVDQRVVEHLVDGELSIGDLVLAGGEAAAFVVVEAVVRLLPGVMGNEDVDAWKRASPGGLLEYPQYTRPASFRGWEVPAVLALRGPPADRHLEAGRWRSQRTLELRPDLLEARAGSPTKSSELLRRLAAGRRRLSHEARPA